MTFGEAYDVLEKGGFVTRKGWDGIFLWLKQKTMVKAEWCKDYILKTLAETNGGEVEAEQVICKYDFKNRKVITGFVPQQEDMAANDWTDVYMKVVDGQLEIKVYGKSDNSRDNSGYVGDLFDGVDVYKKP